VRLDLIAVFPLDLPTDPETVDWFQEITTHVREILWVLDRRGERLLYANRAYERITGQRLEQLRRHPWSWFEAVHPADRERVREELASHQPGSHNLEFRIVRPDGEIVWLWARGTAVFDDEGRVRWLVGVAEDVSERKRAELALEQSVSLLRATLEATADGIVAHDLTGQVTIFNRRFAELWRVPEFAALEAIDERWPWQSILSQLSDPASFLEAAESAQDQPEVDSVDCVEFRDGRVVELFSRPQRTADDVVGRVWSLRDMTGRIRAERALREHLRRVDMQNHVLVRLARHRIEGLSTREAALRPITEAAAELMEVERVGVWLFEEEHQSIRLLTGFERTPRRHTGGTLLGRAEAPSYFAALESERALDASDALQDARTRELAEHYMSPLGIRSMLDAPVRAGGRMVGIVCFEQVGTRRNWTPDDEAFAGSIADLVSIGLEFIERQRAEWSMRFLAESSAILSSSLDYPTTLGNVVHLAIPELAEWCVVDVIEHGQVLDVVCAHRDKEKESLLREMRRRFALTGDSPEPGAVAMRTRQPQLAADATDEVLASYTRGPEHRSLIEALETRSFMALPLIARGQTLGSLTFGSAERRYTQLDLRLAEDLASRAAMAIDNARLHEGTRQASKAKSDFLAVMSHELRTPLTAIMGYAELLETGVSGALTEHQRVQIHRIALRSQDLLRIIEEVLAFSRTESGHERLHLREVDLGHELHSAAAGILPLVQDKGLAFRVHVPEHGPCVRADRNKLRNMVVNLLSNAVKFTEKGELELRLELHDDRMRILVADTGIGISPEQQQRIFEPFEQGGGNHPGTRGKRTRAHGGETIRRNDGRIDFGAQRTGCGQYVHRGAAAGALRLA
jgi:PAS domain S-box-containing protein